ncbi:uncharacterized protein BYT42DRAFT_563426 [Radiomyces spectabilis]|uniref:uncharacterized protein n=1 Tax=Radiomyces spectabilis TaxID=64574 RepID=UPI0022207F9C|nr:uncharacterized protein BYT42DRAFT_563426 [Radiomyces spectabilis]KAI8384714.1 hypothetical protein BYT42DRAFT_563426 [Radiomyces spectabilis]
MPLASVLETNKPFMFSTSSSSRSGSVTHAPASQMPVLQRPLQPPPSKVLAATTPADPLTFFPVHRKELEDQDDDPYPASPIYQRPSSRPHSAYGHTLTDANYTYTSPAAPSSASATAAPSLSATTNGIFGHTQKYHTYPTHIHRHSLSQTQPLSENKRNNNLNNHVTTTISNITEGVHVSQSLSSVYMSEADESESWLEVDTAYEVAGDNRRLKRRKDLTSRMEKLDSDFRQIRERVFKERLKMTQEEIMRINTNTHPSYLQGLAELENNRQQMIEEGRLFRDYQKQILENQFQCEIHQAEEAYKVKISINFIDIWVDRDSSSI